jgi:hypothetical protein
MIRFPDEAVAAGMRSPYAKSTYAKFIHLENRVHHQLIAHSITWLRIAVGAIFLGFGVLKYFPV